MSFRSIPQAGPPKASLPPTQSNTPTLQAAKDLFNKNLAEIQSPPAPESTPSVEVAPIEASSSAPATESVEAKPEPKADDESISSHYANLARKERAQRARIEADKAKLKAERDAFESERNALKSQQADYESKFIDKGRLQTDTINALQEAGLNYDQIVELMMQQQSNPGVAQANNEIRQLKAELKSMRDSQQKSFEDLQRDNEQAALSQMGYEVKRAVKGNANYETIDKTGSYQDVVDLIKQVHEKGWEEKGYEKGTVIDVDTAAQFVEQELEDELFKYASSVSKVQKRLQPKATVSPQAPQTQSTKEQELKTLTNKATGSKPLTARERAIRRFQGQSVD